MRDYKPLLDAASVDTLIQTGQGISIDCRFSLTDVNAGEKLYRESHLPGARYAHLDRDLSCAIEPGKSGRHPLPSKEKVITILRQFGVNNDTSLVFYDDAAGAMAARGWWLARWVGHNNSFVLNGGLATWMKEGRPLSTEIPSIGNGNIELQPELVSAISAGQVLEPDRLLIDARAPDRFAGRHEPLDPVAGHIPGAVNHPFTNNLHGDKTFLDSDMLQNSFAALLNQHPDKTATHYCGSGVTAAHNILAMVQAGLDAGDLYAGSWSEWVQDSARPVATGPAEPEKTR